MSSTPLAYRIAPDTTVRLSDYPTEADHSLKKSAVQERLAPLLEELNDLQYLMWGAQQHALLMIIQGLDGSGKDGILNHVLTGIDPQGVQITGFKVPTPAEAAHDFLWRIHAAAPGKGLVGVYNRSQYEQVLVVRVHSLAPPAQIEAVYSQINAYEQLLADTGTLVVKFYLHMSKDEQRRRLLDREQDITKAWKLNPGDWAERAHWDDYIAAYELALSRCSPAHAPWYVVPADNKWATRLAVAEVLVETLRPHRQGWMDKLTALQTKMLGQLATVDKQ